METEKLIFGGAQISIESKHLPSVQDFNFFFFNNCLQHRISQGFCNKICFGLDLCMTEALFLSTVKCIVYGLSW